jgi:hypothetical protein
MISVSPGITAIYGEQITDKRVVIQPSSSGVTLSSTTPTAETVGASGAAGTGTEAARADHRHAMPGAATTRAAGFMSAADKTKRDASGQLTSSTPAAEAVGATGTVGVSTETARADHRHAMPGLATSSTDGFMSASDKATVSVMRSSRTASFQT